LLLAGCGKKGPPLTPFVLVPAAPTVQAPRRSGADIYVQLVVPDTNLDGSKPAAVSRIELYGVTALTPPPRTRFLDIATLVGTFPVAPAGEPGDAVVPVPDPEAGALHGATVTIRDTLTADELTPRALPVTAAAARARATTPATTIAPPANVLRRFYMAFAFSPGNRPGPPSPLIELPVTVLPPAPDELQLSLSESALGVQWGPSGSLLGWLFESALPLEGSPPSLDPRPPATTPPPTDWLPGPTTYNVYREVSPDPLAFPRTAPPGAWQVQPLAPVNPMPLAVMRFDDPVLFDDRERCYHVRALRGGVESEPSPRRCLRPVDIFPPVAPTNLQALATTGAINLIWDPNVEADLGGYLVLRKEAGSATLLPLTTQGATRETRFSDRTVKPGVRYTYEVRAVDSRVPVPNTSEPAEVTETAR
jgi:hypothetical protein